MTVISSTAWAAKPQAAAKLSHPHVVGVLDQGHDGRTAYLVMEYIKGHTLRDVINGKGALSPRLALALIDPVVEGLGAAHAAGLIHRDIKPENVLIAEDGRIKIGDFGLARAVTATTSTGTLIGTVAYLSPELVLGKPADARSDIYSTGIMLFEMLTGRQPFDGEVPIQVAYQHVNSTVGPPSALVPGSLTKSTNSCSGAPRTIPKNAPWTAMPCSPNCGTSAPTSPTRNLTCNPRQPSMPRRQPAAEPGWAPRGRTGAAGPSRHSRRCHSGRQPEPYRTAESGTAAHGNHFAHEQPHSGLPPCPAAAPGLRAGAPETDDAAARPWVPGEAGDSGTEQEGTAETGPRRRKGALPGRRNPAAHAARRQLPAPGRSLDRDSGHRGAAGHRRRLVLRHGSGLPRAPCPQ